MSSDWHARIAVLTARMMNRDAPDDERVAAERELFKMLAARDDAPPHGIPRPHLAKRNEPPSLAARVFAYAAITVFLASVAAFLAAALAHLVGWL